jgi:HEAT repeat protein
VISTPLLRAVVVAEAVLVLLFLGVAVIHTLWLQWELRRSAPRLQQARRSLAGVVLAETSTEEVRRALAPLPVRLQSRVLAELASSLLGSDRVRLCEVATSLGLLDRARRLTTSRSDSRRRRGAHLLTLYGATDFPSELLGDPDPGVRAQALEWVAEHPDPALVPRVVALLDDRSPLCRFTAEDTLLRIGADPLAALGDGLYEALPQRALETVLDLAVARGDVRHADAAARLTGAAAPGVRARAASLLGATGGEPAIERLEALLDDEADEVRQAAVSAIGRLGHWPAAARVAQLLHDRAWDVRAAAAEALTRLGSPGLLLLRRYAGDDDPFAADMARQRLELAALRSGPAGASR